MFKFNKYSGQASKLLLVLAIVVLVAVIITFLVLKMAEKPAQPVVPTGPVVQLPVYEQTINGIRFVFESAIDRGQILTASEVTNTQYASYQKDLPVSNTGAKFIQVTVGAQNMGTENTQQNAWDMGNIVDSDGRNFVPLDNSSVNSWLPYPNQCGALLKPAFDPTPCTQIYEVSKQSTGLKIVVEASKGSSSKTPTSIDLIVK